MYRNRNMYNYLNPIDFYDVKGDLELLFSSLKINDHISFLKDSHPMLCPGKNAKIEFNGSTIGHIGELNPTLTMDLDLIQTKILF